MPTSSNKAISFILEQLREAHQLLEATIAGVTSEQIHWPPPGKANPVGATYAHIVIGEDGTINGLMKGGAPLFVGAWSGKVGISEFPPMENQGKPGFPDWSGWGRRVKVDSAAMQKYAKAVYAASEEYIFSLKDDDLKRPVSLAVFGLGESTVGNLFINAILGHAFSHCGEISALKGIQGVQGYPI